MIYTLAHIGYLSLFIGLMPLLVIFTFGFRYTVLIEARVATETGGISTARNIWQGKIIGRLMRSSNVFAYLIFRAIPTDLIDVAGVSMGVNLVREVRRVDHQLQARLDSIA